MTQPILCKTEAAAAVTSARLRAGITWAEIAERVGRAPVWTTAALLGQHPMSAAEAEAAGELLGLEPEAVEALQVQPYRGAAPGVASDPTIYRFHEALAVYGPAIKELIHEEFGDGIMSAINFKGRHRSPRRSRRRPGRGHLRRKVPRLQLVRILPAEWSLSRANEFSFARDAVRGHAAALAERPSAANPSGTWSQAGPGSLGAKVPSTPILGR